MKWGWVSLMAVVGIVTGAAAGKAGDAGQDKALAAIEAMGENWSKREGCAGVNWPERRLESHRRRARPPGGAEPLGSLDLDGTKVTDAGLAHLVGLKKLCIADLNDTRVTDAGLAHLAGLKELRSLNLRDRGHRRRACPPGGAQEIPSLGSLETGSPTPGSPTWRGSRISSTVARGTDVTDAGLAHLADSRSSRPEPR